MRASVGADCMHQMLFIFSCCFQGNFILGCPNESGKRETCSWRQLVDFDFFFIPHQSSYLGMYWDICSSPQTAPILCLETPRVWSWARRSRSHAWNNPRWCHDAPICPPPGDASRSVFLLLQGVGGGRGRNMVDMLLQYSSNSVQWRWCRRKWLTNAMITYSH